MLKNILSIIVFIVLSAIFLSIDEWGALFWIMPAILTWMFSELIKDE